MSPRSSHSEPHETGRGRLLVLDPSVFEDADAGSVRRFVDRLSAVRRETVFVLLGSGIPNGVVLPQPDYFIVKGGARINRLPDGEPMRDWPADHRPVDEKEAALYLAQALMIPDHAVHVVAGRDHARVLLASPRPVAVGLDDAPDHAIRLPGDDPDRVNEALCSLNVFHEAPHRIGEICDVAFEKAVATVRRNVSETGFTAAPPADNRLREHDANYAAVWARDGIITGLWTLCLEDRELDLCFRRTLETLASRQTPPGQIPANVRLHDGTAEYAGLGGIASIDAVLWFVIGVSRYAFARGDRRFADAMLPAAEKAMTWLAAHDSNNDSLLEIPEASDWMDLFPRSYNVLHDEVLWYQACLDHAALLEARGRDAEGWKQHATRIRERILELFWPSGRLLMELAGNSSGRFSVGEGHYLLSHVTPFDYSWRCDVGANLLAALTDLLDEDQCERLFFFLWGVGVNSPYPVSCLYPAVQSGAEDWKDYFLTNFLNLADHYHNGGIWPFLGGLWVRFLYRTGRIELARRELAGLAEACRQGIHAEWEFNEWLHGRTGRPMGKRYQAWSAASYVKAYMTLTEKTIPAEFDPLDPERLRD